MIKRDDTDNARPLEQGQQWHIGGHDRSMSEKEQLEQLYSYLDAHYELPDFTPPWKGGSGDPVPADRYSALLPDRITQASMLILGSGVDHAMPGNAVDLSGLEVKAYERGEIYVPQEPTGVWAVTLHSGGWWRGGGQAMEMQWRPEVAAAAALSGATVLDLDYSLAPEHSVADMLAEVEAAVAFARGQGAQKVVVWGYSSGGALAAIAAPLADALLLTFPDLRSVDGLPDEVRAGLEVPEPDQWPRTLLQIATEDEIAARPEVIAEHVTVEEFVARHRVSTPAVARARVASAADFLRGLAA